MNKTPSYFILNGKVVVAGAFVRLSSGNRNVTLETTFKPPYRNPNASLIGVWYQVMASGALRRVWL